MNLDWNGIRDINGSKNHGFEELCQDLANSELLLLDGIVSKSHGARHLLTA